MFRLFFLLLLVTHSLFAMDSSEPEVQALLSQMTLEEKIDYIGGHNAFYIRPIERLGLPELKMADGPAGIRGSGPATSYPAPIMVSATWDAPLAFQIGAQLGYDARARGVHFLLAPGMNIVRSPLCGRNFEYLSEDPYLTSRMAVEIIKGIQSQGVVATAKHFAVYNQEYNRHEISAEVDERTLREIYLPAFEASVKEAKVGALMSAYNPINAIYASQNSYLNNEIAKKEWGLDGIIMSDWNATYDGIAAANGGLDLEMPYGACMNKETLEAALEKGLVTQQTIDDKVRRILRCAVRFGLYKRAKQEDFSLFNKEGKNVALQAALEGMVLLKNDNVLPLDKKKIKTLAVIGPRAQQLVPFGGGSSEVTPMMPASFLQAIADHSDKRTRLLYSRGLPDLEGAFDWNSFTTTLEGTTAGFVGEYFENIWLQGEPALVRNDPKINFAWKERSYRPDGPVNHYSARWTGYFKAPSTGQHTFYLHGNDGFRLFIDDGLVDELVIDRWDGRGASLQHKTLSLDAQKSYKLRVEYFVAHGPQEIQFGITTGTNEALEHAKAAAQSADGVILCVGFDARSEGEDWDRPFQLPEGQDELINEILKVNKKVVVVVTAGASIDMNSWIDKTPALLWAWYPGQEGPTALAQLLFGKVSPSGKLPISFEKHLADNPTSKNYHNSPEEKSVTYKEGLFVGYRHYDQSQTKPLFAFGHGLSYTKFGYSNLQIKQEADRVEVSFDVSNVGEVEGQEAAQVYVSDAQAKVVRPLKELKGFTKLALKPLETRRAKIILDSRAFSYYDVEKRRWTHGEGPFEILVGSSSDKIELSSRFTFQ